MASAVVLAVDNVKQLFVNFTCDAAYPTGGYPFTPASIGLNDIYGVDILGNQPGVTCSYDSINRKLKLFGSGTAGGAHQELGANSTVVSATTVLRLLVIGR